MAVISITGTDYSKDNEFDYFQQSASEAVSAHSARSR